MKTKYLRMSLEECIHSYQHLGIRLGGNLYCDLRNKGGIFLSMLFKKLPQEMAFEIKDIEENGRYVGMEFYMKKKCDNLLFPIAAWRIGAKDGHLVELYKDEKYEKMIDNYFVYPMSELIDQMKQYYVNHGLV